MLLRSMCDYTRGLDWWMDLLNTHTHNSELQAITAPPLISTIHKSPQHPLILFPAYYIVTSRSLATVPNNGDSSASRAQSSLHSLRCRTQLTWLCPLFIIPRHGPHRKHSSSIFASSCCIINNLLPSNGNVFTEPSPRNGRCLQSHRLAIGLYATLQMYSKVGITTKTTSYFLREFWRRCQALDWIASNSIRWLIDD
jgi:hypothetical protein